MQVQFKVLSAVLRHPKKTALQNQQLTKQGKAHTGIRAIKMTLRRTHGARFINL
ncbi:MAG: hypothetical protein ACTH1W_00165 [Advenella sp.]